MTVIMLMGNLKATKKIQHQREKETKSTHVYAGVSSPHSYADIMKLCCGWEEAAATLHMASEHTTSISLLSDTQTVEHTCSNGLLKSTTAVKLSPQNTNMV